MKVQTATHSRGLAFGTPGWHVPLEMGCGVSKNALNAAAEPGARQEVSGGITPMDAPGEITASHRVFSASGIMSSVLASSTAVFSAVGGRKGDIQNVNPTTRCIRLMLSQPFLGSSARAVDVLTHSCLPAVRERLRRFGWRLVVIDVSSELDPARGQARTDSLAVCARELAVCMRDSAGPALLCLLDDTYTLLPPLPPPRIPAEEFDAIVRHFNSAKPSRRPGVPASLSGSPIAGLRPAASSPLPVNLFGAGAVPAGRQASGLDGEEDASGVATLVRRWYRPAVLRSSSGGGRIGDQAFVLSTPADLSEASQLHSQEGRAERSARAAAELARSYLTQ